MSFRVTFVDNRQRVPYGKALHGQRHGIEVTNTCSPSILSLTASLILGAAYECSHISLRHNVPSSEWSLLNMRIERRYRWRSLFVWPLCVVQVAANIVRPRIRSPLFSNVEILYWVFVNDDRVLCRFIQLPEYRRLSLDV